MPKPFIDPDSADTMGRTIWGEARGESRSGKIAIGWVIRNRAEIDLLNDGAPDWWGEGIIGVCKRPGQFSCWNRNDPNFPKLLALTRKDYSFGECFDIALGVLSGDFIDPTTHSTHYHATHILPSWARGKNPVAIIGRHAFYNNVR